jgi:hypothetical protein
LIDARREYFDRSWRGLRLHEAPDLGRRTEKELTSGITIEAVSP